MSVPSRMTSPDDGATLPPMTLSRVDLPAPFGPHSPNRPRSGSASETSCSTLRPPYSLKTPRTSSSVASAASPGPPPRPRLRCRGPRCPPARWPAQVGHGSAAGRRSAPPVRGRRSAAASSAAAAAGAGLPAQPRDPGLDDAGQPLRVHQQHHGEQHALDDEDVDAHPVARALQVLDDQRADDRADDRAPPADEQHDQQGQLGGRVDHGLRHELLGARVDHAAQGGEHAAEHEQLELAARRADPERGRGPLVDAEHEQLEADVGGQDPGRDEHHRREQHDDDEAAAQRDQRGRSASPATACRSAGRRPGRRGSRCRTRSPPRSAAASAWPRPARARRRG